MDMNLPRTKTYSSWVEFKARRYDAIAIRVQYLRVLVSCRIHIKIEAIVGGEGGGGGYNKHLCIE